MTHCPPVKFRGCIACTAKMKNKKRDRKREGERSQRIAENDCRCRPPIKRWERWTRVQKPVATWNKRRRIPILCSISTTWWFVNASLCQRRIASTLSLPNWTTTCSPRFLIRNESIPSGPDSIEPIHSETLLAQSGLSMLFPMVIRLQKFRRVSGERTVGSRSRYVNRTLDKTKSAITILYWKLRRSHCDRIFESFESFVQILYLRLGFNKIITINVIIILIYKFEISSIFAEWHSGFTIKY